jgi:FHS family L-fucose permease-like MFS transporter
MEQVSQAALAPSRQQADAGTTTPMAIITLLFFMWGFLTSLNDVLIPHLKAVYQLSYVQAMLVQSCFFGAYFLVALPAGALIRRIGYKTGAVTGLVIAACGCALFYPAAVSGYAMFLLALFVLAAGITILQVAANPFVTVLGPPATASSRLTLTQAFNSLGTTIGPLLGGMLILSGVVPGPRELAALPSAQLAAYKAHEASAVQGPYLALAGALLALALLFYLVKLPQVRHGDEAASSIGTSVLRHRHLLLGAVGIFLYVGGEVSIGSFMINFLGERNIAALAPEAAASNVAFYWGGAMVGRFIGFAVMRHVSPGKALAANAAVSIGLILFAILGHGHAAMWALIAVGLCNSIMFPTIFSMALHKLGAQTGQGSGILCMAMVGGAVVPFVQGMIADSAGLQVSFVIPAACYVFILCFGIKYANMYKGGPAPVPLSQ